MEAVALGEDVASGLIWNQPRFCFKKKAPIAARSGYDQVSIVPSIVDQMPSDEVEDRRPLILRCHSSILALNAPRSRTNRATIVRRSGHDRATIGP